MSSGPVDDGGSAPLALTALVLLAGGVLLSGAGALIDGPAATGDFINPTGAPVTLAVPAPERVMGDVRALRGVAVLPPWHDTTAVSEGRWVVADAPKHTFAQSAQPRTTDHGARWQLVELGTPEAPAALGWSALDAVAAAQTSIIAPDGTERACSGGRFGRIVCGPDPWNWVGATTVRIRERDERCIWAHPTQEGVLRIRFDGVPGGTTLRGRYAISDAAAERADAGRVTFQIFASPDGVRAPTAAPVLDRTVASRRGFSAYRVELHDADVYTVDVEISAEDVGMRHFCFDGQARPAPAGSGEADSAAPTPDTEAGSGAGSGEGAAGASPRRDGIRPMRRGGAVTESRRTVLEGRSGDAAPHRTPGTGIGSGAEP